MDALFSGPVPGRTARLRPLVIPWVAMMLVVLVAGVTQGQASEGITVSRTLHTPADLSNVDTIDVLRLSSDPAEDDGAITVTWRLETSSWFPAWYLYIQSATGLIQEPEGIKIGPAAPVQGTPYEIDLSYDYESGTLAFAIHKAGDERMLEHGVWRVQPTSQSLRFVGDASVDVSTRYRPIAATWDTVVRSSNNAVLPMRLVDRSEQLLVRASLGVLGDGELRLVVRGTGEPVVMHLGQAAYEETLYPVDVHRLTVGPATATLEYWVDGDRVWTGLPRELTVGRAEGSVVDALPNPDAGTLEMTVLVEPDGPLDGVDIYLDAKVWALEWDQAARRFSEVPRSSHRYNLTAQGLGPDGLAQVRVPVDPEPALWRLELGLGSEPAVSTQFSNNVVTFGARSQDVIVSGGVPRPMVGSPLEPTRDWEPDIAGIEDRHQDIDTSNGAIVFTGSSSIRIWRTLSTDFPGLPIINAGFGGSRIFEALYYADRLIMPFAPHTVVLYSGSNDISGGYTPERVFADYVAFVNRVHEELPDTRIIFISIAPSPARWSSHRNVEQANRLIELYTQTDDRLDYIDVYSLMLGEDGLPKPGIYLDDGVHMNAEGYRIWTQAVRPYLGLE